MVFPDMAGLILYTFGRSYVELEGAALLEARSLHNTRGEKESEKGFVYSEIDLGCI